MKRLLLSSILLFSVSANAAIELDSDGNGYIDNSKGALNALWPSTVDETEVGYLNGVTSAIQTQLNALGTGSVDTSGTPITDDWARFTDADTIAGLSDAELLAALNLEAGTDFYSMSAADSAFEAELNNSAGLLAAISDETGTGVAVFNISPNLQGAILRSGTAVDDDDCTGQQGAWWWDSTDSAFEWCNANSGVPTVLGGGGTGDILADGTVPMTADWSFGAFDITGGVESTWSGLGTFGTLSSGAGGFLVDADGDTTVKSLSMAATAAPTISLVDSDSLDADKTSATIVAQVTTVTAGSVVSDVTHTYKDGSSASGVEAEAFHIDGANDAVEFAIDTTLQAGDILTAELADDAVTFAKLDDDGVFGSFTGNWTWSAGTQTVYDLVVTNSTDLGSTVSLPVATTLVTSADSGTYTIGADSAAELYGGVVYVEYASTITIPAVTVGMSFTVITTAAVAITVDPDDADQIMLDGAALFTAGVDVDNTSTLGDILVCTYYSADGWYCASGSPDGDHWIEGT